MGCSGCSMPNQKKASNKKMELQKCAVCVGIHNDQTLKQCYYCYACGEWICDSCNTQWMNRGLAAVKKLFRFE